jgi:hypothetical protein
MGVQISYNEQKLAKFDIWTPIFGQEMKMLQILVISLQITSRGYHKLNYILF